MPAKLLNQVSAFQYVTVPKAPTYRAIIQIFYEAKQHYIIELRPDDVFERLAQSGYYLAELAQEALSPPQRRERLEGELQVLRGWGNLAQNHDLSGATRLEDYYRTRFVYRLTAVGEAAHRAVLEVEATLGRSGSLQTAMLVRIRDSVASLAEAADSSSLDAGLLVRLLHDLCSSFDHLTAEAGRFLADLDRYTDGQRSGAEAPGAASADADAFRMHKQAVLAYIGNFIEQLRRLAGEIAANLASMHPQEVERVLNMAVAAAELPPALDGQDPKAQWICEQRARLDGICRWFLGQAGSEPIVERLRSLAVGAVIKLTRTLGRLNDRRAHLADRAADFRAMARWFQRCPDDASAHRLYQAAFGMYPARHFHIGEEDASTASPAESFWQAPPVAVPVRLRSHGHLSHAGRPPAARDHSSDKEWIAAQRRRERALREAAYQRFLHSDYVCISDLATLDEPELDALLSLLGDVLAAPRDRDGVRKVRTADGRYQVSLKVPSDSDDAMVLVITPRGMLRCRDHRIRLELRPGVARPATPGPGATEQPSTAAERHEHLEVEETGTDTRAGAR